MLSSTWLVPLIVAEREMSLISNRAKMPWPWPHKTLPSDGAMVIKLL